eukprot:scaffold5364_cov164-Amphora_coffeaeformis.AAC.22
MAEEHKNESHHFAREAIVANSLRNHEQRISHRSHHCSIRQQQKHGIRGKTTCDVCLRLV